MWPSSSAAAATAFLALALSSLGVEAANDVSRPNLRARKLATHGITMEKYVYDEEENFRATYTVPDEADLDDYWVALAPSDLLEIDDDSYVAWKSLCNYKKCSGVVYGATGDLTFAKNVANGYYQLYLLTGEVEPPYTIKASTPTFSVGDVSRTPAPVTSTPAPITTTSDPVTTTSAPVATTSDPITTTSAPVATTSAPVATTSAPVATTSDPVTTTPAP